MVKRICVILVIGIIVFSSFSFSIEHHIGDKVGVVLHTDIKTRISGRAVKSFNINGSTAIYINELDKFGYDVNWDANKREVRVTKNRVKSLIIEDENVSDTSNIEVGKPIGEVLYTDIIVYLEDKKIESFNINGSTAIYVRDLFLIDFDIEWNPISREVVIEQNLESKLYNISGLRVNADFRYDLSDYNKKAYENTFWVPAVALGIPNHTITELKALINTPEKAQEEITVLFEALAFINLMESETIHNAKSEGWEFPVPAIEAINNRTLNCASSANVINYLLKDDYDEVGYMWHHSSIDAERRGGHVISYIVANGEYYFVDASKFINVDNKYPIETGKLYDFKQGDKAGIIINASPINYIRYNSTIIRDNIAIYSMFRADANHFAIKSEANKLYYPLNYNDEGMQIWIDPEDNMQLLQSGYNPKPPINQYYIEDYSKYLPYSNYNSKIRKVDDEEPEIHIMPSDNME